MTFKEIMNKLYWCGLIGFSLKKCQRQAWKNFLIPFENLPEDKDDFIQKALKVCNVFKMKP